MPHAPHSRNRVVGDGGDVDLRKIEREISLSRSLRSSFLRMKSDRSATLCSIFVVVCVYVIGILSIQFE